jgi:hypothetical protein
MRNLTFLFSAILFSASFSCGRHSGPVAYKGYVVDHKVKQIVDPKVRSVNGMVLSSMDFRMYENDSVIADSYAKGKTITECMTMTTLQGDTITITGWLGMFVGFGYRIELFRDTCIVDHFAHSDAEIYKLKEKDSLEFGVDVPCKHYTLALSEKPGFKKGEVLEGVVELKSDDYFEVANGNEKKCRIELTGYFRTDPIGSPKN